MRRNMVHCTIHKNLHYSKLSHLNDLSNLGNDLKFNGHFPSSPYFECGCVSSVHEALDYQPHLLKGEMTDSSSITHICHWETLIYSVLQTTLSPRGRSWIQFTIDTSSNRKHCFVRWCWHNSFWGLSAAHWSTYLYLFALFIFLLVMSSIILVVRSVLIS